jgi:hypothetical protein
MRIAHVQVLIFQNFSSSSYLCFGHTKVVIMHLQAAFAGELSDASAVETLKASVS